MTSRRAALSRTVRVNAWPLTRPSMPWPELGANDERPRRGLSPTKPQHDAGTRIDPVPSPPDAAGTMPAATAAAVPPLDPPGVMSGDHGLTVGPNSTGSVVQWLPHSGVLVLPKTTRPASRYRSTVHAVSGATYVRSARAPHRLRRSRQRRAEILEQERHAGEQSGSSVTQCPGVVEGGGLRTASLEQVGDDRIQITACLYPADRRVEKLRRAQLARRDQRGLPDRVDVRQFRRRVH